MTEPQTKRIPLHVAIIMDGNGRWARQRKLPRLVGHRAGTDNIYPVIECLSAYGVRYVTLYVFSTENWRRPRSEVQGLMRLLEEKIEHEAQNLKERGIKLIHIGRSNGVSEGLQRKVREAIELTQDNSRLTLCVAFNYGSRSEIIDAIKQMMRDGVAPDDVNDELLSGYLYTAGLPDPDLIIRTGGEMRLSNFMLWQAAYSEYYITPTLWPDFGPEEIKRAVAAFSERERRFGGLKKKGRG